MFGADKGKAARQGGKGLRIGIVQARFNESITDALARACKGELLALGVAEGDIEHVLVPGALEIPIALQALAEKGRCHALVALGCVIRGETYHFELVANVILTTETMEQAIARQTDKGVDAARVVVEMANLLDHLT